MKISVNSSVLMQKRVKVNLGPKKQSIFYVKDAEYKLLFHLALVGLELKLYVHF